MPGKYYISPNEGQGARWSFTTEGFAEAVTDLWPNTELAGPYQGHDIIDVTVQLGGNKHTLSYNADNPVLVFRDQDPATGPATLILSLLRRLAPDVPVVWFADFDGSVYPLNLDHTVEQLAEAFTFAN